jgi:hypothetical protein
MIVNIFRRWKQKRSIYGYGYNLYAGFLERNLGS